jgi:hypothetical protein
MGRAAETADRISGHHRSPGLAAISLACDEPPGRTLRFLLAEFASKKWSAGCRITPYLHVIMNCEATEKRP